MDTMPRDPCLAGEARLLSYAIASTDLWYSAIGQRDVYLRREPQQGLRVEGEIPGCGADCNVNLGEILLEYCCGCEECLGKSGSAKHDCPLADRLGRQLMARLQDPLSEAPDVERVSAVMDLILNSMDVAYERDLTVDGLRYHLVEPPINKAASGSGLRHWGPLARRAFVALSTFLVRAAAPDWVFVPPSESEANVLWIMPAPSESRL